MSATFATVPTHTYLMVNENKHMVRYVQKLLEQSRGLVPTSPLGFASTGNVLSLLDPSFQMSLKPSLGWFVLKFNDFMLSISCSVFSLLNHSVGKVGQEFEPGEL